MLILLILWGQAKILIILLFLYVKMIMPGCLLTAFRNQWAFSAISSIWIPAFFWWLIECRFDITNFDMWKPSDYFAVWNCFAHIYTSIEIICFHVLDIATRVRIITTNLCGKSGWVTWMTNICCWKIKVIIKQSLCT